MKRLLISLAILATVISVSFLGGYKIDTACDKITQNIEKAASACRSGDFSTGQKYSVQAEKSFRRNEAFFIGFINRENAEDTGVLLAGLAALAKKDSLPAFLSKCEEAKIGLKHIRNEYKIIPENLF
jgi:hypothetical protein